MKIRNYQTPDQDEVIKLIQETIQTINCADYSESQIKRWSQLTIAEWTESLLNQQAFVMSNVQEIVGFADMSQTGYLDRLYVHKDYQHQQIGRHLVHFLESHSTAKTFTTYASITARPFFEKIGYQVIRENIAELRGEKFKNFLMKKTS